MENAIKGASNLNERHSKKYGDIPSGRTAIILNKEASLLNENALSIIALLAAKNKHASI